MLSVAAAVSLIASLLAESIAKVIHIPNLKFGLSAVDVDDAYFTI